MKKRLLSLLIISVLTIGITTNITNNVFALENPTKDMVLQAQNNILQDGKYSVSINVLKEQSDEYSIAGQYIKQASNISVENGKIYLSVNITRIDWMKNISIFVNGSSVSYNLNKSSDKNAVIKFQIPNVNAKIKFGMNVVPMDNARVAFRVTLSDNIKPLVNSTQQNANNKSNVKEVNNASVSKDSKSNDELPKTGSPICQSNLLLLGGITTIIGIILVKKKN